jgi:hypothetical protein
MSKKSEGAERSRRDFLKLATASAPAAVAAAALGTTQAEAAEGASAEGIADTAHTRAYYASARF